MAKAKGDKAQVYEAEGFRPDGSSIGAVVLECAGDDGVRALARQYATRWNRPVNLRRVPFVRTGHEPWPEDQVTFIGRIEPMTAGELAEASGMLGRAVLAYLGTLPEAERERELMPLWEMMLCELTDAEIERFQQLTGYRHGLPGSSGEKRRAGEFPGREQ